MSFLARISNSCSGKIWLFRLPVTLFLIYLGYKYTMVISYESIFYGLNLGIHEMGHFLFFWTTEFLYVAGGTILQLFVPILSVYMFYRQNDYYAISISLFWISTNLYNIATYLGDARSQVLPLVRLGASDPKHDWHYLLSELNLITSDKIIAAEIRTVAFLLMWGSIMFGIYLLYCMFRSKEVDLF